MSDDFFTPPPFDPATALATLKRTLRDLKLAERDGVFEWNRQPVARARVDGAVLRVDLVKRPSRSPQWDAMEAIDHPSARRIADELKRRAARWADARDSD